MAVLRNGCREAVGKRKNNRIWAGKANHIQKSKSIKEREMYESSITEFDKSIPKPKQEVQ